MMTLWPHNSPCLIVGHRGAMAYAPENTLISFEEAIRRGADHVEMDVQLSKDSEVVIMHDTSVDRTTDGSGLIRELNWKKIRTMDAGIWYGTEYINQHIPSLKEAIARFRNRKTSRRHPVGFIVELKTVRGSGGSLADAVVKILHDEEFTDRAIVISFDTVALQEVRAASKQLATGLLYSEEGDESRITQAHDIGASALCPRKSSVTARSVSAAHRANLAVNVWTANTKNEMKRMLACGVDAVTTNFPDRLRSLLE